MPKKAIFFLSFSVPSYLFPCLSFFLWDAFDIYFSTFEVLDYFQLPTYCI